MQLAWPLTAFITLSKNGLHLYQLPVLVSIHPIAKVTDSWTIYC